MTFKNIQDAVISDRFDETQRADVKNWINAVYGTILTAEDWTFLVTKSLVTVTAGSSTVTNLPTNLGVVLRLSRADGGALNFLSPQQFADAYYGETATGIPADYTVVNGVVSVGPISSETSALYQLEHEKEGTALSADADLPILPALSHMVLVFGAAIMGLQLSADPSWQGLQPQYDGLYQGLRRRYLASQRDGGRQLGRDPLGR